MVKNTCKLCSRRFASQGALASHMHSHATITAAGARATREGGDFNNTGLINAHAGNPKRSQCAADGELVGGESVSTLPRAKRSSAAATACGEAEPLGSMSDVGTHAHDVAWSLVKLSRDTWASATRGHGYFWDDGRDDAYAPPAPTPASPILVEKQLQFQCADCKKFFRSYQALGGHRASSMRGSRGGCCAPRVTRVPQKSRPATFRTLPRHGGKERTGPNPLPHEHPYCYRALSCGQALGNQQPEAAPAQTTSSAAALPRMIRTPGVIDLNLPPPSEEVELYDVSDPRFNPAS